MSKRNPLTPVRTASARDEILGRLRAALARPQLAFPPVQAPPLTSATRMHVTSMPGGAPELSARFARELEALHGTCEIVESAAEARMALVNRLMTWYAEEEGAARGARLQTGQEKHVLSWSPAALPLPYIGEALLDTGFTLVAPKTFTTSESRDQVRHIRYGITGVEAAFATTGSLLVVSGAQTNRMASLLPYRHIALIPMTRLFATIEQWLAVQRETDLPAYVRSHANMTLITGPSKSADIEQNLTRGVHGPKFIHAIIFDDTAEFAEPHYGVFQYGPEDDEEILGGLLSASRRTDAPQQGRQEAASDPNEQMSDTEDDGASKTEND